MIVFSGFNGMNCGRIAFERAGIKIDKYYSSEIDKYANAVTNYHYPDTIQVGDIRNVKTEDFDKIDILIGGSSCQDFSFAGKQNGMITEENVEITDFEQYMRLKKEGFEFKGESYLFWEFVRLLKEFKPKYFLLENVVMKEKWKNVISKALGVEPILINSALVSAQNRKRLYWTNIPNVEQPEDKGILSRDILLNDFEKLSDNRIRYSINAKFRQDRPILIQDKLPCVTTSIASRTFVDITTRDLKDFYPEKENIENYNGCVQIGEADLKGRRSIKAVYSVNGKSPTLITSGGGHHEPKINIGNKQWRKLTPLECERLQTVNTIYEIGVSLCLDQAKNYVSVVEKNHKLQKLVLSVGNDKLQESVKIVDKNIKLKNQQTKSIVQRNADTLIQKQTRKCTKTSQKEQPLNVDTVEKKTMSNYQDTEGGFAILNAFTNLIQEKIIHNGEVELLLKDRNLPHQKNGKKLLKMYGKEIMRLADIILEKQEIEPCIYTTLYRLNIRNIEQMLITLYWFAKSVIDLSTLKKIKIKNILLNYEFENSYTLVPFGKRMMSNSQRYKMLGNGWTVDVISHIFKNIKE